MRPLLCAALFTLPMIAAGCGGGTPNGRTTHRGTQVGRENGPEPQKPKSNTLTPQEIADGWILLFDGKTTAGWEIDGDADVKDGVLILGAKKKTTAEVAARFGTKYHVSVEYQGKGTINAGRLHATFDEKFDDKYWGHSEDDWDGDKHNMLRHGGPGESSFGWTERKPGESPLKFRTDGKTPVHVRSAKLRPLEPRPLIDG